MASMYWLSAEDRDLVLTTECTFTVYLQYIQCSKHILQTVKALQHHTSPLSGEAPIYKYCYSYRMLPDGIEQEFKVKAVVVYSLNTITA